MSTTTSLSVIVPVYNEIYTVIESLKRLLILRESRYLSKIQIIIVDDGSIDGSAETINAFVDKNKFNIDKIEWLFFKHHQNLGKGKAIQTALMHATSEVTVIHDADLEYYPSDINKMIKLFIKENVDAVFGSRFTAAEFRRVLMYRHQLGNKIITFLCNLVSNLNLTDVETCYKAVRTKLLKTIPLESNDFRIEPEITIKLAKRRSILYEVPIRYSGRTYEEGKKINWIDGIKAIYAIIKFGLSDNIFKKDDLESRILLSMSRAEKFNSWISEIVSPFIGQRVIEIGAGIGNITKKILPREKYFATDINSNYLKMIKSMQPNHPGLNTMHLDLNYVDKYKYYSKFDTVLCMNVLEHLENDKQAIRNISNMLKNGGHAVILVPKGRWLYGSQDKVLKHKRRYSRQDIIDLVDTSRLEIVCMLNFNRISSLPWFVNGKIFRKRTFSRFQIKTFDFMIPVIKQMDKYLPLPSLSMITILKKNNERKTHFYRSDQNIGNFTLPSTRKLSNTEI